LVAVLTGTSLLSAQPTDSWKFDVVHLKNGRKFQGLVLRETAGGIEFRSVVRRQGERTKVFPATSFHWDEIRTIDRLDAADRKMLEERVSDLEPGGVERQMEKLELKAVPWGHDARGGLSYSSRHFILISNAREDIARRAAVHLNRIYAAFTNYLPPRHRSGLPTTIVLVKSLAEYRKLLGKQGHDFHNPAYYDPALNKIVCASDLERLGDDLDEKRKQHRLLQAQLREMEGKLEREYKGRIPAERRDEIAKAWKAIESTNRTNADKFQKATRRLFQTLYHEAFHAYLATFVYPPAEAAVPRWLNEGLAQIFETATLNADELLVERPDPDRLKSVQAALHKDNLVSLDDLLRAGADKFLVEHAGDEQVSDRYYLASWALAYYLMVDRKKLGTPELDQYVRTLKKPDADPLEAFCMLVGQPPLTFESAFHQYLLSLKPNGGTAKLILEKESNGQRP
jgi:hypothetical protein